MIKIKIKDNSDFIINSVKVKNYNVLECITLLDTSINILRNNFKLSDNEIWELLKAYKKNLKEVK